MNSVSDVVNVWLEQHGYDPKSKQLTDNYLSKLKEIFEGSTDSLLLFESGHIVTRTDLRITSFISNFVAVYHSEQGIMVADISGERRDPSSFSLLRPRGIETVIVRQLDNSICLEKRMGSNAVTSVSMRPILTTQAYQIERLVY